MEKSKAETATPSISNDELWFYECLLSKTLGKSVCTPGPEKSHLLIFGQNEPSRRVYIYDICNAFGYWKEQELITERSRATAAVIDGVAYIIGGQVRPETEPGGHCVTNGVETANLRERNSAWQQHTPMHERRRNFAAVAADDQIFVVGGINQGEEHLKTGEYYRSAKGWTMLPCMNDFRCDHALVFEEGFLYAIGGCNGRRTVRSIERLRLTKEHDRWCVEEHAVWCMMAVMEKPRRGLAAVHCCNSIYIIGGATNLSSIPEYHVVQYNPYMGIVNGKKELAEQRRNCGACVANGKVYVVGGFGVFRTETTITECNLSSEDEFTHLYDTKTAFQYVTATSFFVGDSGKTVEKQSSPI